MNDLDLQRKKTICLIMIWLIVVFIPIYWWYESARQGAAIARLKGEAVARGAEIYLSHCVACHGKTGDNIPGKHLRRTAMEEAILAKVVSRGRPGTGMPAFGDEEGGALKKFEVSDVIAFIRSWDQSIFESAAAHLPQATAKSPGAGLPEPAAPSEADSATATGGGAKKGKIVYSDMGCAGCHGNEGQGDSAPSLKGKSAATIKNVVRSGLNAMPSFDAASLSDADLNHIITFLGSGKK